MASERRQLQLLAAIVLLLIAVVAWQLTRGDAAPVTSAAAAAATGAATPGPAAAAVPGTPASAVPAVALPLLSGEGTEPADTGRDPFRFDATLGRPAGSPGRPSGQAPAAPVRPVAPPPSVQPAGPPPPPPIQLRFIGLAKQGAGGKQYVVLRDDRGVYYGAEGDVIEGRYRILRVGPDSVDVAYVDGRGRRTIPLSGGLP